MKVVRLNILCTALLFLGIQASGQIGVSDRINQENNRAPSIKDLEEAALKETARGNNYGAFRYYSFILEAEPLNVKALNGYGEAAIKFAALDSAEVAFQKLVDNGFTNPDGAPFLRLAGVKFQMGKYEEARELYRRFLFEEKPAAATAAMKLEAETRLGDCEWALETLRHPVVEPELFVLLDSGINTPQHSENAPYLLGDVLYFTSNKFTFEKDRIFPKRSLHKIMQAKLTEVPGVEETPFNEVSRHTTHNTFNVKGDVMYYSQCDYVGNTVDIFCEIYLRRKLPDGNWSPAELLPPPINIPGFTNTQPSIGSVPGQPHEMLYFVSDRTGGKGKKDIWCSKVMDGKYSAPMNVSNLNTVGNDVTPFYHADTKAFYFSTDSLQSMGGFDVYRASWDGKDWVNPVNLGVPINSGFNDVYYMLSVSGKTAYMASNRRGSFNQSEEGCCYDLYQVDYFRPKMSAITYLKKDGVKTQQILPYTTLTLIEVGNPNAVPIKVKLDASGRHNFDLLPGKSYMIIGEKDRFAPDTVRFSTPPKIWREEIIQKLYLEPNAPDLVVTVYDKDTGSPINGATSRFFDLGKTLPNGTFEANKGQPQEDTHLDNNRYLYPLEFDHRYQVVASKAGYTVDSSAIVSTEGMKGAQTIELKLYLRRGLAFRAFTTNKVTGDTLYGVTYRLLELPSERQEEMYISPKGKDYQTVIAFEKRYRIIASKQHFTTDSLDFSTANLPKVDFQTIVKELKLRPLSLISYLPIPLYFDNDEPDKRTLARTTKKDYITAYRSYYNRKATFIERYTEGLTGQELQDATAAVDSFFENDVRGGWERLMEFSEVLYEILVSGDSIEITLKGYASPRAGTTYNKNLTDRRAVSVNNHFNLFDGGIYKKFVDSKQLVIKREANGETKVPPGVSDDIKDERNSIYSVPASRERRLEIIGAKVNIEEKL
jgi:hypothetical protein